MASVWKRAPLILVLMLFVLAVAACSSNSKEENTGEQATPVASPGSSAAPSTKPEPSKEPTPISIYSYDRTDYGSDRVVQEIEKLTNTKLSIQAGIPWDPEQLNVMTATGNYPDVITIIDNDTFDRTGQWIKSGILSPITDEMLEQLPNLKALLTQPEFKDLKVDGKYYLIPMRDEPPLGSAGQFVFQIRQDWLDKLSLPVPTTTDEFFDTLMKFKTEDPDGNKKADTYGLITNGLDKLVSYSVGFFGIPHDERSTGFLKVGDGYEYWAVQPQTKEALKWVKKLYDNGLIHPDTLTQTNITKTRPVFAEGRIGVTVENMNFDQLVNRNTALKQNAPDGKVIQMSALKGTDGAFGYSKGNGHWAYTAISSQAKDPLAAAKLLDFLISEEGTKLSTVGIEGVHYKMEGDKLVWNDEEKKKDPGFNVNTSGQFHELNWGLVRWSPMVSEFYIKASEAGYPGYGALIQENLDRVNKYLLEPASYNVMNEEWSKFMGTGKTLQNEFFIQAVLGKVDIDKGFDKFVASWRAAGGEAAMKSMSDAIAASNS
ncbi:ABC-type glycerol-3-phosphate transport system, substrate-binding protein [Paenibacillaceae bacterium GAS479]|nr:ABC-type glycerol-3-phosphate transport system, substrate-binding protein [Paenibacillaceae bacterium GAS479]